MYLWESNPLVSAIQANSLSIFELQLQVFQNQSSENWQGIWDSNPKLCVPTIVFSPPYVHTTGIGCPDKVIYPLCLEDLMLLYLLLAGSSAFVTAKWTVIHHTIPIPSFWSERGISKSRGFRTSSQNQPASIYGLLSENIKTRLACIH